MVEDVQVFIILLVWVQTCLHPGAAKDGATVEVQVRDNGPGLQGKSLDALCATFYSTKDKGLGLGLGICRAIAESHGGALLPLLHRAVELEAELHHKAKRCDFLQSLWDSLTPQQSRVALLVAEGHLNKETGSMLDIGERMVEVHRSKAFDKLGVDSPAELATTIAAMKSCGIVVGP